MEKHVAVLRKSSSIKMVSRSRTDFKSPSLAVSGFFSGILPHERIALINLGCVRNLVDSETILGQIKLAGACIVDVDHADTVVVNTCAFIIDAKKETINTLLALINLKKQRKIKKIVALGCFAKRYADIFKKEFPEIDHVFGILPVEKDKNLPRVSLTPSWYAYLKICESCYNHCSFCAIPGIKGKFSSRKMNPILEEVETFESKGVKEINVIGQDITAYGLDLGGRNTLTILLKNILAQSKHIHWFRLLYAFPKHITDDLLDLVASESRMCKYMDVPLQHISDKILRSMNRKFTKLETMSLVEKIRKKIPECS
ncbi:MAG: radical SAM protein, partial [Candidatus Omnitrophota bacterium]